MERAHHAAYNTKFAPQPSNEIAILIRMMISLMDVEVSSFIMITVYFTGTKVKLLTLANNMSNRRGASIGLDNDSLKPNCW